MTGRLQPLPQKHTVYLPPPLLCWGSDSGSLLHTRVAVARGALMGATRSRGVAWGRRILDPRVSAAG